MSVLSTPKVGFLLSLPLRSSTTTITNQFKLTTPSFLTSFNVPVSNNPPRSLSHTAAVNNNHHLASLVHLYNSQEAVSTGFIKLLNKQDSVVSTYRDHVHALSKGVSARAVMSELFGKVTRCCRGQGGSMHLFSKEHNLIGGFAFIGEGIPIANGAAFSSKYRREVLKEPDADYVTLAFFGDGTCNNGQFYECQKTWQLYVNCLLYLWWKTICGLLECRISGQLQILRYGRKARHLECQGFMLMEWTF
jgi:hypothetical protein